MSKTLRRHNASKHNNVVIGGNSAISFGKVSEPFGHCGLRSVKFEYGDTLDDVWFTTGKIKLTNYGLYDPRKGKKGNQYADISPKKVGRITLPLDPSQKSCVQLRKFIEEIDFAIDKHKDYIFEGKSEIYKIKSIITQHLNKNEHLKLFDSITIIFPINHPSNKLDTDAFQVYDCTKNGEQVQIKINSMEDLYANIKCNDVIEMCFCVKKISYCTKGLNKNMACTTLECREILIHETNGHPIVNSKVEFKNMVDDEHETTEDITVNNNAFAQEKLKLCSKYGTKFDFNLLKTISDISNVHEQNDLCERKHRIPIESINDHKKNRIDTAH